MRILHRVLPVLIASVLATMAHTALSAELTDLDASTALQELQQGKITSEQLVRAYLDNIDRHAALNDFIFINREGALKAARQVDAERRRGEPLGPLAGLPISIKDNIHVAGMTNTAGTPALKHFIPSSDASVIRRLRKAGAIVLGKNNMHELAFGITSNNACFGAVHNAYVPENIPGGSSGGTASAVAARLVAAGVGTDTGASVRLPSALNGVIGLRPTIGRYPTDGITPLSATRDTPGLIGRSMPDIALLDSVIAGGHPLQPIDAKQIRLGVVQDPFWKDLDPQTKRLADAAITRLKALGVTIVQVDVPDLGKLDDAASFPIVGYEAYTGLPAYLTRYHTGVSFQTLVKKVASPDVKAIFATILKDPAGLQKSYHQAITLERPALQEGYAETLAREHLDAIIFPTSPLPARPIATSDKTVELNGRQLPTFAIYGRNTDPAAVAGLPAISIPVGLTKAGLPVGLELDGAAWSDRHLLAVSQTLLDALPEMPAPKR